MKKTACIKWLWLISVWLIVAKNVSASPVASPIDQSTALCAKQYTVQADDQLSKIADKFFGNLLAYPTIVVATNQQHQADASFAKIANPDRIEIGWKLCVPNQPLAQSLLSSSAISSTNSVKSTVAYTPTAGYTLDNFAKEFSFSPEVDPKWVYASPELPARFPVSAEYRERRDKYGYMVNYLWNENFLDRYYSTLGIFYNYPSEMYIFHAANQATIPRYRYPPNVTLPTGLTTNEFGWRGRAISFKKPPKTIRLACVGASTTVDGHSLPLSYPELLQNWLNLWSQKNGYDLRFEVINGGRESISSPDIYGVVHYEILPMDVDYIIYYEGSNQFTPRSMINWPADEVFGQPPPGLVPNLAELDSKDKTWLDSLSEYSVLAARVRSVIEELTIKGLEPLKPAQTFVLPAGQDEMNPDRAHLGNALALATILGDLDKIKKDTDSKNVKLLLGTFNWFAYEGMTLDPVRNRTLYSYLNRAYWPVSYANMRRMADYQNRVFKMWAAQNNVNIIDVAGMMPRQPDLFDDAIHNTYLGVRVKAWVNFQSIVPIIKQDIESKVVPHAPTMLLDKHPYIEPISYTKTYSRTAK